MKADSISFAILLLAACCSVSAQTSAGKDLPCATRGPNHGWHTYVNRVHGFCFRYPPVYKRVPSVASFHADKDTVIFRRLHSDAYFFVWYESEAFDLQRFMRTAGETSPPGPVPVGEYTFYYYGAGGGGVSYPDRYFFNLRGQTLYITFAGPYNGNTSSPETKRLERELLETFRTF